MFSHKVSEIENIRCKYKDISFSPGRYMYEGGEERREETSIPTKKGVEPLDDVDVSISVQSRTTNHELEGAKKNKSSGGKSKDGRTVPTIWFVIMGVLLAVGFFVALGIGLGLGHPDPALAPYQFTTGAVASDHELCSRVGKDIMMNGGNALDAVVSTAFCLGVVNLHTGGVGAGGYLTFYNRNNAGSTDEKVVITKTIDGQVVAPGRASEDMFSGSNDERARKGGMAIAIPGEVAGLYNAHKTLGGALPWASLLEPSIRLAKGGFAMGEALANAVKANEAVIMNEPTLREILATTNGVKQRGDRVYLPKLAATLEAIAKSGTSEFYEGELAMEILEDINEAGGNVTLDDLKEYKALDRDTVSVELGGGQLYNLAGIKVYAPPPPSCGVLVDYILNILEGYEMSRKSVRDTTSTVETYHRFLEASKFAFAERSSLGDLDNINLDYLTNSKTATTARNKIVDKALPFAQYGSKYAPQADVSGGATHISIRDKAGNAVSYTSSLSLDFGAKKCGSRTGIIFNAGMGDFSLPDGDEVEGLKPSPMNFISPGKRPLSSMTPLILVDKDDDVKAVIGSSGGSEMITSTALMAAQIVWFEDDVIKAINRPRVHTDLSVNSNAQVTYEHEDTLDTVIVTDLASKGQIVGTQSELTSAVNIILQTKKNRWYTSADKRVPGSGYAHY